MKTPDQAYVAEVLSRLDQAYGTDDIIYLTHEKDWQLLVAVILSAQCTDARVNMVTPHLFARYDTLEKLAAADPGDLEEEIHSIGFYHAKAKNIIGCAERLVSVYGGKVPDTMEDLLTLPAPFAGLRQCAGAGVILLPDVHSYLQPFLIPLLLTARFAGQFRPGHDMRPPAPPLVT